MMDASREDDGDPLLPPDSCGEDKPAVDGERRGRGEENGDVLVSSSSTVPVAGLRAYATVIILFMVNLLNYVDRYTVAANLLAIQKTFKIEDSNSAAGILQTVFIISYMLMCPVFGYLGDRYSRKLVMSFGILFWAGTTLACSFVPANKYWAFVLLRGLVGVGEASYSTIASTLIADLFKGNQRTRMLTIFYFAIPVGSGLGYIAGSGIAQLFGAWQWAFRVTPPLGVLSVVLIMVCIKEPTRGQVETGNRKMANTDYCTDLKALSQNKSFIFSSLGFTGVSWVVGALSLWAPVYVADVYIAHGRDDKDVAFLFGAVTCVTGFLGTGGGTTLAQLLRKYNKRSDPLICGVGMLFAVPFLFLALVLAFNYIDIAWAFVFIAEIGLFLNWGLVPDMLLYVIIPPRRSTANACQMVMGHLLGDALSPWIVGFISDQIRYKWDSESKDFAQMMSLQYALYTSAFITALGGGAFLATALYIERAKARVEKIVENAKESYEPQDEPLSAPVSPTDIDIIY